MVIDLTTWLEEKDYQAGFLRNISDYLLLKDHKHFFCFYGHISSIGIFRSKIAKSKEPIGRAIIPVECENAINFCKTIEDIESTSFFNARYSSKPVRKELISCFYERLSNTEVDDFEKGRLDLSESLMNDTEARLELIKNRFPNITLFVMSYKNDSLDSALNSIAIVLNEEKIKMDQIHVSGFGQVHQHDFKIIY